MADESDTLLMKWNLIKEQLIALNAFQKNNKTSEDFRKMLSEDIPLKSLNSQVLSSICYFLLGIIDIEERDKLIKWPLINIQTNTKFRKGLSALITNFQEKYPWINIKKLPESYFVSPHGGHKKVVDFILRLTNLAIHVALNDPELLLMHSGQGVTLAETEIMKEIISKAISYEEEIINENVFPLDKFEAAKCEVSNKCITLRQENDKLQQEIDNLLKCAVNDGFISSAKNGVEDLKSVKDKKLLELNKINEDLSKYHKASKDVLLKLKALRNPLILSCEDFGCDKSSSLTQAILKVCENLNQLHQNIISKTLNKEEAENFYQQLIVARVGLSKENDSLKLCLSKMYSLIQKNSD